MRVDFFYQKHIFLILNNSQAFLHSLLCKQVYNAISQNAVRPLIKLSLDNKIKDTKC